MQFDQENLFTFEKNEMFPERPLGFGLPDEIVCVTRHVDPERVFVAYQQGIFPWYEEGQPVFWWMTDPRMVLQTKNFTVHHSLRKRISRALDFDYCGQKLTFRLDSCTEEVIRSCALPRREEDDGTWITEEIVAAYSQLAQYGYVHSIEAFLDGELSGGLYGVSIGRMFYGESMFTKRSDLSKMALAVLVAICRLETIPWIDCQQETEHLKSMGAAPVPLKEFKEHLNEFCMRPAVDWNRYRNQDLNVLLRIACVQE